MSLAPFGTTIDTLGNIVHASQLLLQNLSAEDDRLDLEALNRFDEEEPEEVEAEQLDAHAEDDEEIAEIKNDNLVSSEIFRVAYAKINAIYKEADAEIDPQDPDAEELQEDLEIWKLNSIDMLKHSSVSPMARKLLEKYTEEKKKIDQKWAAIEKKTNDFDPFKSMLDYDRLNEEHALGYCFSKVEALEGDYFDKYFELTDGVFEEYLVDDAKDALDDQVKECEALAKSMA